MLRKLMVAAMFGFMVAGAAFAQTSGSTGTTATDNATGAAAAPGVLDDPVMMKPFYTDEGMTTLRPATELEAAFKAMGTEDRDKIAQECQNVTTQRSSFCKAFNDANKM